jgi:hypothetical protein
MTRQINSSRRSVLACSTLLSGSAKKFFKKASSSCENAQRIGKSREPSRSRRYLDRMPIAKPANMIKSTTAAAAANL